MKANQLTELKEKLVRVGLAEQQTKDYNNYRMTFYFSEKIPGNKVWWWSTYKEIFNDSITEPINIFHYGILIAQNKINQNYVYIVSLGKSHFYLSKFIETDFGISLAVRMAKEDTILLKKSRLFVGAKRQEIASYTKFIENSYSPGESVEHLKLKAINKKLWGEQNIIFANSVQMSSNKNPSELANIFETINETLSDPQIIQLPKLENIKNPVTIETLDNILFKHIKNNTTPEVAIEEFTIRGISFCFKFLEYNYKIFGKDPSGTRYPRESIGNTIELSSIAQYLQKNPTINDINSLKILFSTEDEKSFSSPLKELLDFYVDFNGVTYFLRNGEWCSFNQTFAEYLYSSLNKIPLEQKAPLIESDYQTWKQQKEHDIANKVSTDDLTYREYYFNNLLSTKHSYILMDRLCEKIKSLEKSKRDYKVEVADLYDPATNRLISVKISDDAQALIYNIEQSKTSLESIKQNLMKTQQEIKSAALWIVSKRPINKITDINSIQFLLALEGWKKKMESYEIRPHIYVSQHIKT